MFAILILDTLILHSGDNIAILVRDTLNYQNNCRNTFQRLACGSEL